MTGQTSYAFVIKSTFSNYRANMSSGITINVNGTPGTSDNKSDGDIRINVKGDACLVKEDGKTWTAENDKVTINGETISSSNITYSYSSGSSIPLDIEGDYTITYKISYNGESYTTRRNVSVKEICP